MSEQDSMELIEQGIKALFKAGDTVELRVPKAGKSGTISGYFDDHVKLAEAVVGLSGRHEGVYYTINPVNPALLARAENRVKSHAKSTTQDGDIVKRQRLLVDMDPVRPAGISSTDAEKELSRERARTVYKFLKEQGWPGPTVADSGNGTHLVYEIDLPNDTESLELVKRVLNTLAGRFDDNLVKVDRSVFNASRICKAYGSMACKGDSTEARPHRLARVLVAGKGVVTKEQLEKLAGDAPEPAQPTQTQTSVIKPEQIQDFLESQEVEYKECVLVRDGQLKWVLDACPFNPDHVNKDAAVFLTNGMPGFKCLHNSCSDNHWKEFRAKVEENSGRKFRFQEGNGGGTVLVGQGKRVQQTPTVNQDALVSFDTIEPQKQEWLWPGKVPLGATTIFAGAPSLGKTLVLLDLAARGSTGDDFLDGVANTIGPFGTILMSAEDDAARTIKPRLMGMGADYSQVYAIPPTMHDMKNGQPIERTLRLDKDLYNLKNWLTQPLKPGQHKIKLVVIDPLSNYAGAANINAEQEIRAVLMPLNSLAQELGIAIVTVMHNNKRQGLDAMQRVIGATGIAGVTRMGWSFVKDPEETGDKLMLQMKENLGKFHGIRYNTQGVDVKLPDGQTENVATVKYLGISEMSIHNVIVHNEDTKGRSDQAAKVFLKQNLTPGVPVNRNELMLQSDSQMISRESLKKTAKALGVAEIKSGQTTMWVYPELVVGEGR